MTKIKFTIDFIANGDLNDGITRMVTNHNEGKCNITLRLPEEYGRSRFAMWPTVSPTYKFIYTNDDTVLHIFENEKETLLIEERIVHELEPIEKGQGEA